MPGTSAKNNKAILQAAKALAAAASSLSSAAEALALMCQDDGDPDDDPAPVNNRTNIAPSKAFIVDYEDSDDEYMIKAREQVRIEAASMPERGADVLDLTTGRNPSPLGKPGLSATPADTQPYVVGDITPNVVNDTSASMPPVVATGPSEGRSPSPADATHTSITEHKPYLPKTPVNIPVSWSGATTPTPSRRTWTFLAAPIQDMQDAAPADHHFETPVSLDDSTLDLDAIRTGADTPTETPFQNLLKRWPRPTRLQKEMLESLRTECDMLVCHGKLKSQAHAILVHCMEVLGEQQFTQGEGIISALIIVPQQTTGRLYLNFANELLGDFGLPHKALLLPGGNSDVVTEAERMASERIDILISSPRVFINHVNNNPALRIHLANLRFVIFPDAHELIKKDEFLNYQFNMIKKRMPTRAKSPRQIIIASSGSASSEPMERFTTRAFATNSALIVSSKEDDQMLESVEWLELLGN